MDAGLSASLRTEMECDSLDNSWDDLFRPLLSQLLLSLSRLQLSLSGLTGHLSSPHSPRLSIHRVPLSAGRFPGSF
jgi:hypothetical protein